MLELTVGTAGAPPGHNKADWGGYELMENQHGKALKWKWIVGQDQGEHAGKTTSCITGTTPSNKNACGKLIMAMTGNPLPPDGTKIDLTPLIGKRFLVIVSKTATGGAYVTSVTPMPS